MNWDGNNTDFDAAHTHLYSSRRSSGIVLMPATLPLFAMIGMRTCIPK